MTKLMIVAEAYGRNEELVKQPLVGATGRLLNELLETVGIIPAGTTREVSPAYTNFLYHTRNRIYDAASIYLTNVFRVHPEGNKIEALCGPRWGSLPAIKAGKYMRAEFLPELERLGQEIHDQKPNLILGLGSVALWALLGTSAIRKNRGAIAQSRFGKLLPTWHPASLFPGRSPENRPVLTMDLYKAKREMEFAEVRRPNRFVYLSEAFADIEFGIREMHGAMILSVDIETVGRQITCIGFAWTKHHSLVIPIFDQRNPDKSYWSAENEPLVWRYIAQICNLPVPKLFQNGMYDIRFLYEQYGITVSNCEHDTMLLHHALQPELPKGLGFLGSVYSDEPAWKLMRPKGKGTIKREDE